MPEVRELSAHETQRAARVLLKLRPQYGDAATLIRRIDDELRPGGYRLAGSFDPGSVEASAAAGFRVTETISWGRAFYVDDLVTLPEARRRGHADALFAWLDEEAVRLGCEQFHLDSGVGPEREHAHRFYFNHGLRITSYHFARGVRRG